MDSMKRNETKLVVLSFLAKTKLYDFLRFSPISELETEPNCLNRIAPPWVEAGNQTWLNIYEDIYQIEAGNQTLLHDYEDVC